MVFYYYLILVFFDPVPAKFQSKTSPWIFFFCPAIKAFFSVCLNDAPTVGANVNEVHFSMQ